MRHPTKVKYKKATLPHGAVVSPLAGMQIPAHAGSMVESWSALATLIAITCSPYKLQGREGFKSLDWLRKELRKDSKIRMK